MEDSRKKDLSPTELVLGRVTFKVARHFGFCYGVENAIEIAYRALAENPDKRVFLLSEMIHNPHVNDDLMGRGIRFINNTDGSQRIPFDELGADDIVIVPAFGTTVELFAQLESLGIDPQQYNTTCPFVEKVWKRSAQLGSKGYTVIIHGKHYHEETRATFSHARLNSPSLMIRDLQEAEVLAEYIRAEHDTGCFDEDFAGRYSQGFNAETDLQRIGVVNQTTMLAAETQDISALLRAALIERFGAEKIADHFADTRDTLCYATNENQEATKALIESSGDLAVVVGGYNSSNTSHLVELCEQKIPTFYIKDATEIVDEFRIRHLDLSESVVKETTSWLPLDQDSVEILITAGASCPDVLVDQVVAKIASFFESDNKIQLALEPFEQLLEGNDGLLIEINR